MHGVYGLAGGARRRPTRAPAPDVDARLYRALWGTVTPPDGSISANSSRPSSVTHLYVSTKGDESEDNSNWLAEVAANMYDLAVELDDDPNSYAMYRVTAVTVGSGFYDFTVTYLSSDGVLPDGGAIRFEIHPVPNALLTAKGDLMVRGATSPLRLPVGVDGAVLCADASQSTGLNWLVPTASWFGTGSTSSSTLGANTTLAANLITIRNYTTLDLVTFTLKGQGGAGMDEITCICCSVLLTGNGGSIVAQANNTIAGGAAQVRGGSSGAGGLTGGFQAGLFVYARKVSGTVTVNGNGLDGGNGGNASGVPTGVSPGAAGSVASNAINVFFTAAAVNSGTITVPDTTGAAGGSSTAPAVAEHISVYFDVLRYFTSARWAGRESAVARGARFFRAIISPGGGGSGASGGITNSTAASNGGGGGGSYSFGNRNGADGGAGGAGGGTIGAGGGGGGGGTAGCFVGVMVGEFAAGTSFTASANGGNGGNGGNGVSNGGGGGGGAGGLGGYVHCVFPSNYSAVTTSVTATGGTKGTKGLKAGLGTDGSNGNDGSAGTATITTWAA